MDLQTWQTNHAHVHFICPMNDLLVCWPFLDFVGLTKWKLILLLPFCNMEDRHEMAGPAILHLSSLLSLLVQSSTCFLVEPSFCNMEICHNMEALHSMCSSPKNYFMTGALMNRPHLSCCLGFHDGISWSGPTIKHCNNKIEA